MAQSPLPLATAPESPSLPAAPTDSRKVGEKKETTLRMLPVSDGDTVEKVWFGSVWWTSLGTVYLVSSILQEKDFDYSVM